MSGNLANFVARELDANVPPEITVVGDALVRKLGGVAVLFYGSTLRTGDLDGVLDFYVLTARSHGTLMRKLGMRWLWPDVSFHEVEVGGRTLRAKVAAMPVATFEQATRGEFVDTTIWARFVQPAGLLWSETSSIERRVRQAVSDAIVTAARFAAVLGPARAAPRDYWLALFRETYRAEMRVEPPGREQQILRYDTPRWEALLPIAWEAGGVHFARDGDTISPQLDFDEMRTITQAWLTAARAGKSLNVMRLIKAAFTFDGAARYGLWKVHRHTGVEVALTPWRERHPVLAAPGVLWRVLRAPTR